MHSVFWVSSSYLTVNIVVLNQFTVTCIENFASWLKRALSLCGLSDGEKGSSFRPSTTFQRRKGWICASKCSFTCICEIFWPLNPSTTTVYARSSFYPSQRFKASFTRREGYPCARVTLARGLKLALVYKQISQVGVSSGSTLPALLTCFVTRDIFCNGQKFEITLKFSVENTLNSQKREIIIVVDRK